MTAEIGHGSLTGRPATRRAAVALAAGALAAVTSPLAAARQTSPIEADIDILNYLLSLEFLESALVEGALASFTDTDWNAVTGEGDRSRLALETIRDQEQAHTAALRDAITTAGGVPVGANAYEFGYQDAAGFLTTAASIEQTITAAYAGAILLLATPAVQVTVIGIHSVEARHAAWLKQRATESPFPDPIDQPLTREKALANLAGFSGAEAPQPTVVPTVPPTPVPPTESVIVVVTETPPVTSVATVSPDARNVFAAVIRDAAGRLNVPEETVQIVEVTPQTWPDSSLGCPQPGEVYMQVLTEGYLVVLDIGGRRLEYHTDLANRFVLCTAV